MHKALRNISLSPLRGKCPKGKRGVTEADAASACFFISGGGTGGHIYPAFTIAEKLLENPENKVFYIGCRRNLEFEISKQYQGINFLEIDVTGMPRKLSFKFIVWAFKLFCAWIKTVCYILKYKPKAVFCTGGYVSAPVILAAKTLNKPYIIHDCDSIPGLVSKFAAKGAAYVSAAFETSKQYLQNDNFICMGNPVRQVFYTVTKEEARKKLNIPADKKVITAFGGSQGAKTINSAVTNILKPLTENENYFVIFQTGKKNYDETIQELEKIYPEYKNNSNLIIRPYFDEMVYPLKAADMVIARAGSLSLSEILASGAPSILIPYPFAAQDHQRKNAQEMCERGFSLYLDDNDCTSVNLLNKVKEISDCLEEMRSKINALPKVSAA